MLYSEVIRSHLLLSVSLLDGFLGSLLSRGLERGVECLFLFLIEVEVGGLKGRLRVVCQALVICGSSKSRLRTPLKEMVIFCDPFWEVQGMFFTQCFSVKMRVSTMV